MISEKMKDLVSKSSVIRAMFEEGKQMAKVYGKENVYDFSLGNPSVAPPETVKEAIKDILDNEEPTFVHGYTSNSGYEDVLQFVAEKLNQKFGTDFTPQCIAMTNGAAGGINVIFKVLLNPGDEVIAFAPFFGEYRNYAVNYDANLMVVDPDFEKMQINFKDFESKITPKTKAVIINSPNNPSGVIYSEETLNTVAEILYKKQNEFGTSIYLVSDEPYRELAYDGAVVPYVTKFYKNAIVGYSFSKTLSLPGERIGYIAVSPEADSFEEIMAGVSVATRILGFVNAPSLFQRVVLKCFDEKSDLDVYDRNRKYLYNMLTSLGFECIYPQGAFYLFPKTPIADDAKFCNDAKEFRILMVPGSAFGCPGYARLAYCVSFDTIKNSEESFKKLAEKYGMIK